MRKQMKKSSLPGNLFNSGLPERISRINGGYLYSLPPPPASGDGDKNVRFCGSLHLATLATTAKPTSTFSHDDRVCSDVIFLM
jgi:hypothetical protein